MANVWEKRQVDRKAHEDKLDRIDQIKSRPAKTEREMIWDKACREYLKQNEFCNECDKRGYLVPADRVSHIKDPKDSQVLFWDVRNWQGLCTNCHRRIVGSITLIIPAPIPADAKLYMVK